MRHKFSNGFLLNQWRQHLNENINFNKQNIIILMNVMLMFCLFSCYYVLNFYLTSTLSVVIFSCLLGILISLNSIHIAHDSTHGALTKNKFLKVLISWIIWDAFGKSSFLWTIRHNIEHHVYTNIKNKDRDLNQDPFLRLSLFQEKKPWHKYQHIYVWFLYPFSGYSWLFGEFGDFFFNKKIKKSFIDYVLFISGKLLAVITTILLPIYMHGLFLGLISWIVFISTLSIYLSFTFQLSHINVNCEGICKQITPNNEFFLHQILTTIDYKATNRLIWFLTGGLNTQVVHHLNPDIHSFYYPEIAKELKIFCEKRNIQYINYDTLYEAFKDHYEAYRIIGNTN